MQRTASWELEADPWGRRGVSAWTQPRTPQFRHWVHPQLPPDPGSPLRLPRQKQEPRARRHCHLVAEAITTVQKLLIRSPFPDLKLRFGAIRGLSPRSMTASGQQTIRLSMLTPRDHILCWQVTEPQQSRWISVRTGVTSPRSKGAAKGRYGRCPPRPASLCAGRI